MVIICPIIWSQLGDKQWHVDLGLQVSNVALHHIFEKIKSNFFCLSKMTNKNAIATFRTKWPNTNCHKLAAVNFYIHSLL